MKLININNKEKILILKLSSFSFLEDMIHLAEKLLQKIIFWELLLLINN